MCTWPLWVLCVCESGSACACVRAWGVSVGLLVGLYECGRYRGRAGLAQGHNNSWEGAPWGQRGSGACQAPRAGLPDVWDCYSHFADGKTEPQGALVLDLPLSDSKVCALPTEACGGGESLVITSDVGQPRLQKQVISAFGFPSSLRF